MQNAVTGVAYNTSTGVIQYSIAAGSDDPSPLVPPWRSGQVGVVQTFPGASEPPDSQTALNIIIALPPWSNPNATSPGAGLAIIGAPANFDPAQWFKWKGSGGQLVEKTQVHLRLSGKQILADGPITSTVQIGSPLNPGSSFTVVMSDGVAQLSSPLVTGTQIYIVTSDPNFWSDPNTFA